MSCFMQDYKERRGPLWLHVSATEINWLIAASVSAGLLLGIIITLYATSNNGGTPPCG